MKAHPTPFGSSVVPPPEQDIELSINPIGRVRGTPAGVASSMLGSIGVAGPKVTLPNGTVINGASLPDLNESSAIAKAVDNLIDAFANKVADRVIAKLEARSHAATAAPDVEQLNEALLPVIEHSIQASAFNAAGPETLYPSIQRDMPDEERVAKYSQMHTDFEQAMRERDFVKVQRFAPSPITLRITRATGSIVVFECAAYAGCFGQGYTDGAAPDEYVLVVDGKRLSWVEWVKDTLGLMQADRGQSFTFERALLVIDALIHWIISPIGEYGVVDFEQDAISRRRAD